MRPSCTIVNESWCLFNALLCSFVWQRSNRKHVMAAGTPEAATAAKFVAAVSRAMQAASPSSGLAHARWPG